MTYTELSGGNALRAGARGDPGSWRVCIVSELQRPGLGWDGCAWPSKADGTRFSAKKGEV